MISQLIYHQQLRAAVVAAETYDADVPEGVVLNTLISCGAQGDNVVQGLRNLAAQPSSTLLSALHARGLFSKLFAPTKISKPRCAGAHMGVLSFGACQHAACREPCPQGSAGLSAAQCNLKTSHCAAE